MPVRVTACLLGLYLAGAVVSAMMQDMLIGVSRGTAYAQSYAPLDAPYLTQTPNGTLTGEQAISLLTNGLLKHVGGVLATATAPTDYINTSDSRLSDARTPTSHTHGDADLTQSYSGVGACGANTWASTLSDNAAPTCTQPGFANLSGAATDTQVPNTITLDTLTQITTRAISDTTGTLAVARGGTNLTASADDNVMVGNGTTWETRAVGSCSGASNALTYNTTTNAFGCNSIAGGSGPTVARIAADRQTTSNVFADVTNWTWAVNPTTTYTLVCDGSYTSAATTTALQLGWNGPASPTAQRTSVDIATSATAKHHSSQSAYDTVTNPATGGAGTALPFHFVGTLENGSNSGTLAVRFRSEVNSSAVTILRGSVCVLY